MNRIIRNITIWVEHSGKRIHIAQVDGWITANDLLGALEIKANLPHGTNGILIRKLSRRQLLPAQTLGSVGIQDGETLVAEFERVAGGYLEFYPDGKVKKIETEPEETPYLAEILREIRLLQSEIVLSPDEGRGVESTQRRLAEARENLQLIEERLAEFVLDTDPANLQLVKQKRHLEQRIADLKALLERLSQDE